jgi:hypothetical protein
VHFLAICLEGLQLPDSGRIFPDRPSFHLLVKFFSPAAEQPEHRPAKSGVIVVPQLGIVMLHDNEPRDADLA